MTTEKQLREHWLGRFKKPKLTKKDAQEFKADIDLYYHKESRIFKGMNQ